MYREELEGLTLKYLEKLEEQLEMELSCIRSQKVYHMLLNICSY
jgi:hypothetical protein